MSEYNESRWAEREFSGEYAQNADRMIMERDRLIGVLVAFYGHFLGKEKKVSVLDLGCGDGGLTLEIAREFGNVSPTLVDGSPDMLEKAKANLHTAGAQFVEASFQELLSGKFDLPEPEYGFIFSSLAVHHLESAEKADLYSYAYEVLSRGGYFMNIDVVLAPSEGLEDWYMDNWRDWLDERGEGLGIDIVSRYKDNRDNRPGTLEAQLLYLKRAGFSDVDCYYKNGIFAVFGGRKP